MSLSMDLASLWPWLPVGYAITVAFETPVLLAGLGTTAYPQASGTPAQPASPAGRRYTVRQRIAAALWLTGVTYPVVAIVLPIVLWPRTSYFAYVVVAEAFAILAECLLFRALWRGTPRDLAVVALANVVSASAGWFLTTG